MANIEHGKEYVAYYRKSLIELVGSKFSENGQKDTVHEYINQSALTLIAEYTEKERRQSRRPMLQEALSACQKKNATLIMATIDPLFRNAYFLSLVRDSGVPLIVCDAPDVDFTSLRLLARFAEREAAAASLRIKRGIAKAKETVTYREAP